MSVIYSPKDVQQLLGIDSNTLRKYATLLEGHGYHVQRNSRGHRGYVEKDVITLRKLMEYSKQEGMTMDQSVEAALTRAAEENKTVTDTEVVVLPTKSAPDSKQDPNHDEILERIEHLEQINLELINYLKEKAVHDAKQEEKMNKILKYVERTEHLEMERMKVIEEETRLQIAAASQKKWWQWWK